MNTTTHIKETREIACFEDTTQRVYVTSDLVCCAVDVRNVTKNWSFTSLVRAGSPSMTEQREGTAQRLPPPGFPRGGGGGIWSPGSILIYLDDELLSTGFMNVQSQ